MSDSREPPRKKRAYRSWLTLKKPVPPKSTFYRQPDNQCKEDLNKDNANRPAQNAPHSSDRPVLEHTNLCLDTSNEPETLEQTNNLNMSRTSLASEDSTNDSDESSSNQSSQFDSSSELNSSQQSDISVDRTEAEDQQIRNESPEIHAETDNRPQLIKVDFLDEAINENLTTTKFEVLLMILNFSFRHGLTGVATEDLCKLVNCILGSEYIPTSQYWMRKVFGSVSYTIHFYCSVCECYIGEIASDKPRRGSWECPIQSCRHKCDIQTLNDGYFFVTLPVKAQLQTLLESTENIKEILNHRFARTDTSDLIRDVYDGSVYSELSKEGNFLSEKFNLSGTVNTDGAVVFRSLKNTLHPIHFRLNEFPPNQRYNQNNSLSAGIYFGKKEPNMMLFLTPFIKEMKELYEIGFDWSPSVGESVNSKVILLQCVLDSVAKAKVQNMNQFNGYWGCGYCLHPGVVLDYIPSNHAKYVMNDDVIMYEDLGLSYTVTKYVVSQGEEQTFHVTDRNDLMVRSDMQQADVLAQTNRSVRDDIHVRGMKGTCALNVLIFFNLVFGFAIDYLHCVLLGVCRTLTGMWLDSDSNYFVGKENLERIEKRLKSIKSPSSISRRPRPLSERIHWKGNEWRAWLLYYSLPCLVGSVPSNFLKHYCFFVTASFMLLGNSISRDDVKKAAWFLVQFVVNYGKLYGDQAMFYNVHLLLHLGKMVELWGPWWCYSAFSFENANGCLIKLVKGTRGVASQIAEKYSMCRLVPSSLLLYEVSSRVLNFCEDLLCYRHAKLSSTVRSVTVLGSQKLVYVNDEERFAFERADILISDHTYERLLKNGVMYHAKCYSRKGEKSDDSVVRLQCDNYGVIHRILIVDNQVSSSIMILVRRLNIDRRSFVVTNGQAKAQHIKCCSPLAYGVMTFVNAEEIAAKSILLQCGDVSYVTDFPNIFEKD